ncbi:MAG: hypothetical protein ACPGTQ_11230 [Colwellia sp.]
MNKLAVFAFTLLMAFGAMLWLLADASLNQYLKSQIMLQGKHYSGQNVEVKISEYAPESGQGYFEGLKLSNLNDLASRYILEADKVNFSMEKLRDAKGIIEVRSLSVNHLILNVDTLIITEENNAKDNAENNAKSNVQTSNKTAQLKNSNISLLKDKIVQQLASNYPKAYPHINAKKYALQNPTLNADVYIENNPEQIKQKLAEDEVRSSSPKKKSRGKQYTKIKVPGIYIKSLTIHYFTDGKLTDKKVFTHLQTLPLGGEFGIETNQLGGEILIALLNLEEQH